MPGELAHDMRRHGHEGGMTVFGEGCDICDDFWILLLWLSNVDDEQEGRLPRNWVKI